MGELDAGLLLDFDGQKKKLVLVGPPAAGKTTFKRVFFEQMNPLLLLSTNLEPTRGIESNVYSFFNSMIAVWDLAGQEIDSWLGDRKEVFHEADIITCMLDATAPLKDTVTFLIRFLKVRQDVAPFSELFLLVNKCDVIHRIDLYNKLINIERFVAVKFPQFATSCQRASFHKTSIMDAFFVQTLIVACEIMKTSIDKHAIPFSRQHFKDLEKKMQAIITFVPDTWYSLQDIAYKLHLDVVAMHAHLEDLHYRGYVDKHRTFYKLSEQGAHLASACAKQATLVKSKLARDNIGFFLNLKAAGKSTARGKEDVERHANPPLATN